MSVPYFCLRLGVPQTRDYCSVLRLSCKWDPPPTRTYTRMQTRLPPLPFPVPSRHPGSLELIFTAMKGGRRVPRNFLCTSGIRPAAPGWREGEAAPSAPPVSSVTCGETPDPPELREWKR